MDSLRTMTVWRDRVGLFIFGALLGVSGQVQGFETRDLPRFCDRMIVYSRGDYAVGVSKAIEKSPDERARLRNIKLDVYYVSKDQFDRCFSVNFGKATQVVENENSVVFTCDDDTLTLRAEGVSVARDSAFPEGKSGAMFCMVKLDRIRFDDALAYRRRGANITVHGVRPYALTLADDQTVPAKVADYLSGPEASAKTYAVRTEEGLWTTWGFDLQTEGVQRLYDSQGARLMIAGGGSTPAFYNTAGIVEPGGSIRFRLDFQAEPESGYPLPVFAAPTTTMIDSHVHITVTTDLRDSALMARKHGYRYGLLSILYREGDYGRHFMGDEHMFETIERYPDVFVGFGLVQLNKNGFPGYPGREATTPTDVERLWRNGARGLKTLVKWSKHEVMVDDVQYDPIYAKAAEYRMPIVFHTEGEKYGSSHTRVAAAARRHPAVPMILAHLASDQIEVTITELRRSPNLYIQHMHLGYKKDAQGRLALQCLVEAGLADRILFGSDVTNDHTPLIGDSYSFIQDLKALDVPQETIDKIMFKTMAGLLANVKLVPGT